MDRMYRPLAYSLAVIAERKRQRELAEQQEQQQYYPVWKGPSDFERRFGQQQTSLTVQQERDQYMQSVRWHGSRKGTVHISGANQYDKLPRGTIVVWPDGDCWKKP